ncbi:uncharacterized protein KY384_007458 [Bacidia gigantensis]|uniref:uncharacterized protein n=1 Tax=Bacidia gigantensis TaxID=2732470 RepID=UPI001D05403E|nr:uncharacterized protein KY384_007458 [Bacidia gigantensis]KAG8528540.1 hypothetical protein KY384_007458 [Bacidia gigantensis]
MTFDSGTPEGTLSDASSSRSSISEVSPSSRDDSDDSSPVQSARSHKRRAPDDRHIRSYSRVKRLKPSYNGQYRLLFNETVELFSSQPRAEGTPLTKRPQSGKSHWTADEKQCFFGALSRYGTHNSATIATAVVTKSESEICLLLTLLRRAAAAHEMRATKRKRMFDVSTIDAAIEISQEIEGALEEEADSLAILQHQEEARVERGKYPKHWLLTSTAARWAKRCLNAGEVGLEQLNAEVPAAILLDLQAFLGLSKVFFMNSSDLQYNWRTYAERRRSPSIMHTAFSDLHTMTYSFTKRIVCSTLHLAASRIRAETMEGYMPNRDIKRSDVQAALHTLGIAADTHNFWTKVARKCNLVVYEDVRNRKVSGKQYNYEEVEEHLLTYDNRRGRYRSKKTVARVTLSDEHHSEGTEFDVYSNSDKDGILEQSPDGGETEQLCETRHDLQVSAELQEARQDDYMEKLDQGASAAEETRLQALLGITKDPSRMNEGKLLRKKTLPPQKTRNDLIDWIDQVDYASEWEAFETPMPEDSPM